MIGEMTREMLVVVDVQPDFMPATESDRLGQPGYGKLPVPDGQAVVEPINRLMEAFDEADQEVVTTQDWHQMGTAHFAAEGEEPNWETTWPPHCLQGTFGAELHPDLDMPLRTVHFVKGTEILQPGEFDTSYSPHNAHIEATGQTMPEFVRERRIGRATFVGLATEHCVAGGAIDAVVQQGLEVAVAIDGCRGINDERIARTLARFAELGIQITTVDEVIARLQQEYPRS